MKRAVITVIVLVVLIGGGVAVSRSMGGGSKKDQNQYRIAQVQKGKVRKTVSATGVLKPWRTVDVRSRAGGRILNYGPDLEKVQEKGGAPPEIDEGSMVKRGAILVNIDPSDTLLTYNSARADIDSNRARVDQTTRELQFQEEQTQVSIANANASLKAVKASSAAAKARAESARKQAEVQKELTNALIESSTASLSAERERLRQLREATINQQRADAQAAVRQAEANLKNAELQWKRQKALLEKGFIAASNVDQAEATYSVAKATHENAKVRLSALDPSQDADVKAQEARVRQLEAQLRTAEANRADIIIREQAALASEADYKRSLADVQQATVAVRQAQAGRINNGVRLTQIAQAKASGERAKASLVNAQVQLDETKVTAPSDGIILKKYIEAGTLIPSGISAFNSTGTNILQFGDTSRMYVDVQVDETDIANIDLDQKVDITFDAYPTTPFEGKVIRIDPQMVIEQNVTTSHVRVEVDNSDTARFQLLKPGMNGTCEFIVSEQDEVVMVPNEAIKSDADGTRYVEISSGGAQAPPEKGEQPDTALKIDVKIEKRKLTSDDIGLEGNNDTEIKNNLKEGESIVVQTIEPTPTTPGGGSPFGGGRGPGRR
jgi:HlyD family secretion protein